MLKKLFLLSIALAPFLSSFAQNSDYYIRNRKPELEVYSTEEKFSIEQNLSFQLSKKNLFGLTFKESEKSEKHNVLSQTHNGVEIFASKIRTVFDDNNKAILSTSSILNNFRVSNNYFPEIENIKNSGNFSYDSISSYKKYYFPLSENNLIASLKVNYYLNGLEYFIFFDSQFKTLYKGERFIHKKSTEIKKAKASVFMPDPITSSNKSYGGNLAHNSGSTNPEIEAEQFEVDIDCKFENGIYYLENDHIKIQDMYLPFRSVVNSADGNFIFNRSQTGFQQVNAFYHLNSMKKQLLEYGFSDAVNYQIRVDADGANGVDNSFFHPHDYERGEPESSSTLEFGAYVSSSGHVHVPDAEDAEVLIHEFTHAIINSYARERISIERMCLEEALADYIAVSYATAINQNNWEKIFKWDAHNEFWDGRYATSDKCYSNLYFANIRDHIDVWVAPLMDLYFSIGREETDKLVLHSLIALDANTTMKQAAKIIMAMDNIYNSSKYSQDIYNAFNKYCILGEGDLELGDDENFRVLSSDNFTGGSFLTLKFKKIFNGNIQIINLSGQIIESTDFKDRYFINIHSKNLNNGIFLIKVKNNFFEEVFKVVKM